MYADVLKSFGDDTSSLSEFDTHLADAQFVPGDFSSTNWSPIGVDLADFLANGDGNFGDIGVSLIPPDTGGSGTGDGSGDGGSTGPYFAPPSHPSGGDGQIVPLPGQPGYGGIATSGVNAGAGPPDFTPNNLTPFVPLTSPNAALGTTPDPRFNPSPSAEHARNDDGGPMEIPSHPSGGSH